MLWTGQRVQKTESVSGFGRGAVVLHRKIGGNLEQCRIRFRAREIDQLNNLRAFPGILASDRQIYFEVRRIPELSRGNQRPAVPNYAGVDGKRFACADDVKIVENAGAQALASKEARTVVARADRCRRKRSRRVIAGDIAMTNRNGARCSRVSGGVVKDDIHELGFLI